MLNWHETLAALSRKLLQDPELRLELPDAAAAEWLGTAGADADTIARVEASLGTELPASYRDFLLTSNGFTRFSPVYGPLLAVTSIGWFRELNPEWLAIWTRTPSGVTPEVHAVYGKDQDCVVFREEYLEQCLQVSSPLLEDGEHCGAVVLLNPVVRTTEGEWEAWELANWYPGAARYRSFAELMLDAAQSLGAD